MQQGKNVDINEKVNVNFKYLLYKPKSESKEKLPLIVFLHGAGERGDDLQKVKIHGIPKIFDTHMNYNCIAVSPQCPQNTFWVAELKNLKIFIDYIIKEYNIDETRIYLTGLSMGGYGTWYMAMAYPNMFAAIAPVCGGGMPWNANVLKMPVWAFHGEADTVVPVLESINMVNKINEDKCTARLTVFPNVGHNAWDYAYNDELILWLLGNHK